MPARNYLWNKAPFLRIIIATIGGIILQWYIQCSLIFLGIAAAILILFIFCFHALPIARKYAFRHANGFAITSLIIIAGAWLVWMNDIRHNPAWIGNYDLKNAYTLVTLQEPLVEKAASFKAEVHIDSLYAGGHFQPVTGKAILYFKKDPVAGKLSYGSKLLISKPIGEVKNGGNPGSFDYKRYCLFQGITHQINLGAADYVLLPYKKENLFYRFLFNVRSSIINIIRQYIKSPKEQGLAEALLIGYKDDLDKNLVQSYTNTGVVHIIAISGLHLGLIYWLLSLITKPLKRRKLYWLRLALILCGLWLFSLLAGGQPSILRSAVMFSVIAVASVLDKRTSIYNTLALSAFLLLCYNPYWLWDVGFQLSYAAVLSIIIFYRPVYNLWYQPNKALDFIWQMGAVSIAAQILTLPVSLYHFHQFPLLFLFTNILAIPLSSIILMGEILLCALFFLPPVAALTGQVVEGLLRLMNNYIESLNNVSFAVWDGISISLLQAVLLTAFIMGVAVWLLHKNQKGLWLSLLSLFAFLTVESFYFMERKDQKKVIVYNVPRYQAIDLIDGTDYIFIGDKMLEENLFLRNFHIQPTRILYGVQHAGKEAASRFVTFYNKKILVMDTALRFSAALVKEPIDILILSHNPKIYINELAQRFAAKQIIIDGSVPQWKARLWQKDCDLLHIPCFNVSENGAFVMNIE